MRSFQRKISNSLFVLVPSASCRKRLSRHDHIVQLSRCLVDTMDDRVSKLSDMLEELVQRLRIRKIWSRRLGQGFRVLPSRMGLKRRQFRALAQPYDVPPHGRFLAQFQKDESVN